MSVGARLQAEHAVGDVVHHRDPAVAGDRDDAVAQVPDHVPVEAVRHDRRAVGGAPLGVAVFLARAGRAGLAAMSDDNIVMRAGGKGCAPTENGGIR